MAAALTLFLAASLGAAAPAPVATEGPLVCTIHADATCELGKVPQVKVTLRSRTNREVVLVGSLDGSDCGMRYPHCRFEVIGPDGKSAVKPYGRCGNTGPVRAKDLVVVPAGRSFDTYAPVGDHRFAGAYQLQSSTFNQPGKYRIRFTYSTEAAHPSHWGPTPLSDRPMPAEVANLLRRVPRTTVVSNEVVVEVVRPGK